MTALIEAELVEQVRFGRREEYAFRHPLIRAVAYESQLKSDRVALHRTLASAIEARDPAAADENAALIAEHLEAAGDLHAAFRWHLRAGTWLANRDFAAARSSWRRAQQIADGLPDDEPDRASMRIAPRALLCGTAHRLGGGTETGFDELRELCTASGDLRSLAIGLNGHLTVRLFEARRREASRLADELVALLDSIGDPALAAALSLSASTVKSETAEMTQVLRLTQQIIDLADAETGTDALFIGSPLALAFALRGDARVCLGITGWKEDLHRATAIAQNYNPLTRQAVTFYTYVLGIPYGVLLPDATALRDTAETAAMAEHAADNVTLFVARMARGVTLVHHGGRDRETGLQLLGRRAKRVRPRAFSLSDHAYCRYPQCAGERQDRRSRRRRRTITGGVQWLVRVGPSIWCGLATAVLAETLMQRGRDGDHDEAQSVMDAIGSSADRSWLRAARHHLAASANADGACPRRRSRIP